MADNLTAPAAGAVLASDEIGGVHYPRTKVSFGADGEATDVSSAAPLPVALSDTDNAVLDAIVSSLADNATGADIAAVVAALADNATDTGLGAIVAALTGAATEAKQDTLIGHVDGIEAVLATLGTQTTLAAILAKLIAAPATEAKQDTMTAAVQALVGTEYEAVAASATNQALGAAGAAGDLLTALTIIPATTSPGQVQIKDGAGTAITVFLGGADSVGSLHPFTVPLGIRSGAGAWQITTGADVSVLAAGNFT